MGRKKGKAKKKKASMWACMKCKRHNAARSMGCERCGRPRFDKDMWEGEVEDEVRVEVISPPPPPPPEVVRVEVPLGGKLIHVCEGEEEVSFDCVDPKVVWLPPYVLGEGAMCASCRRDPDGWMCYLSFFSEEDTLLCGACTFSMMGKLLRFYVRLRNGREPGISIPNFTPPIVKGNSEREEEDAA